MYADANDGKPWTQQDLEDFRACIDAGLTVSQTAAASLGKDQLRTCLERQRSTVGNSTRSTDMTRWIKVGPVAYARYTANARTPSPGHSAESAAIAAGP